MFSPQDTPEQINESAAPGAAAMARSPLILTGESTAAKMVTLLKANGVGRIWAHKTRIQTYEGERWAFDSGVYSYYTRGTPVRWDHYRRRLDHAVGQQSLIGSPYLNAVPDIVGGGAESLELSMKWLPQLPDWPHYLVVQDGMNLGVVKSVLGSFAGIFLGGTDRFKATAPIWSTIAHAAGKRFHYGRAGTLKAIRHARFSRADSLDSSFPLWSYERFELWLDWCHGTDPQRMMLVDELRRFPALRGCSLRSSEERSLKKNCRAFGLVVAELVAA